MRRFHFRLDPALRLRHFRLEAAQSELASAQRALADEEAERLRILEGIAAQQSWRAQAQEQQLDASQLTDAAKYELELFRRLEGQEQRIREHSTVVDVKTEVVHKCHAECESLERLKGRRKAEHFQ